MAVQLRYWVLQIVLVLVAGLWAVRPVAAALPETNPSRSQLHAAIAAAGPSLGGSADRLGSVPSRNNPAAEARPRVAIDPLGGQVVLGAGEGSSHSPAQEEDAAEQWEALQFQVVGTPRSLVPATGRLAAGRLAPTQPKAVGAIDLSLPGGGERSSAGPPAGPTSEAISMESSQPTSRKALHRGAIQERIVSAALAKEGADVTAGPARGLLACAWAVNRFALKPVLGRKFGENPNLVVSVREDLLKGGAKEVPQSAARPGDIVVAAGPGTSQHIGVVVPRRSGAGVEALSTRGGRWAWRSDLNFAYRYRASGQIYRLPESV